MTILGIVLGVAALVAIFYFPLTRPEGERIPALSVAGLLVTGCLGLLIAINAENPWGWWLPPYHSEQF